MRRCARLAVWLATWALLTTALRAAEENRSSPALVRITDSRLQVGLDPSNGTVHELIELPQADNYLLESQPPFALWQFTIREGDSTRVLSADRAGPSQVQRPTERPGALRLVWDNLVPTLKPPLRVEVDVRLDGHGPPASRWELTIAKPRDVRIHEICFPRLAGLKPRANEVLAVPSHMGVLTNEPRKLLRGKGKGQRLAWHYPSPLSLQCLAYYEPGGPGFYAACDDTLAYGKTFALWGDGPDRVCFEITHTPEQEAAGDDRYRLPYAVVLGTFRGDWTTAAGRYRQSPAARIIAERGRLERGLVPDWVRQTGLWVWNRGRSEEVLTPAAVLGQHLQSPVSVFWHWWHDCAYDAGFPEYLPPREGAAPFRAALEAAHRKGIHAILYMNQRLWGMNTSSWTREGAAAFAVKDARGNIHSEVYNRFMSAPCAPMCLGTDFWRSKYAGLAHEAVCELKADGIYMDQACATIPCYDPRHGHVPGPGRYWTDAFGLLALGIRDRCAAAGQFALAGEFCGEPWLPYLDLMLNLDVSQERTAGSSPWEPIPFFQAVYHTSAVFFGNYGSLARPPYDERWPAEKAPADRLTLLDRKFARQFYLEQARSFAWGQQPTLPNFLPEQLHQRRDEIDYLTRMVHTRLRALKYLVHGTWLRPPALDVPQIEIDVARIGTYLPLAASVKRCPAALAGAWRAPDGDVGLALASITDEQLSLRLPIDRQAYGLPDRATIYRIDETGRQRVGLLEQGAAALPIELPPRAVWVLEFSRSGND